MKYLKEKGVGGRLNKELKFSGQERTGRLVIRRDSTKIKFNDSIESELYENTKVEVKANERLFGRLIK